MLFSISSCSIALVAFAITLHKADAIAQNVILTSPGLPTQTLPLSSSVDEWCAAIASNGAANSYLCDGLVALVQCSQLVVDTNNSTVTGTTVHLTVNAQCGESRSSYISANLETNHSDVIRIN